MGIVLVIQANAKNYPSLPRKNRLPLNQRQEALVRYLSREALGNLLFFFVYKFFWERLCRVCSIFGIFTSNMRLKKVVFLCKLIFRTNRKRFSFVQNDFFRFLDFHLEKSPFVSRLKTNIRNNYLETSLTDKMTFFVYCRNVHISLIYIIS